MTTLYFYEEINIPSNNIDKTISKKELDLAIKLVNEMKIKFNPKEYIDLYQNNIKNAIDDKLNGKKIKGTKKTDKKTINDLMKALEKSLKDVK